MKRRKEGDSQPMHRAAKRVVHLLLLLVVALAVGSPAAARQGSPSGYHLARSVVAMGGGPKASVSYQARGTSGQATGVGRLQSASYRVQSGYWTAACEGGYDIYLPLLSRHSP